MASLDCVGDFAIDDVIGEGGSAVVYAARRGALDVALKVLKVDASTTPRECERFLGEARLLSRVRHPNVVTVLGSGTLPDGRPYLTMPRLRGRTLATHLESGALSVDRALEIFEGIAAGVTAIHRVGLVHRDMKAENVFLQEDGTPIVLDLGIARDADAGNSTTTQQGIVRGTPATMAPERFFGAMPSVASDVYETALILYVMLVGKLPWDDARGSRSARRTLRSRACLEGFPRSSWAPSRREPKSVLRA